MSFAPRPSPRRRLRPGITLFAAGLLATTGLALTAPSAQADLSSVGPNNPAQANFPGFYRDPNGLSLQLCLDGPPLCVSTADELLNAGADGEGFYYAAEATAAQFTMSFELEAAFFADDVPIVFQRLQFTARRGGLVPNADYQIVDPFGTHECTADEEGVIDQNDCRFEFGGIPDNPGAALTGDLDAFLTWDTFGQPASAGGPPAGYIGDGVTPHLVTGSPAGIHSVRVTGDGIAGTCDGGLTPECAETNLFTVWGKVAPGASGSLNRAFVNFGAVTTPVTQRVTYASVGTAPVSVTSVNGSTGFTVSNDQCSGATLASGSTCVFDVTFNPAAGVTSNGTVTVVDQNSTKVINLTGKGRQAVIALSTNRAVLPDTAVGSESSALVTVTNSGDEPFTLGATTLTGPNAVDYRLGLTPSECLAGASLGVGASCNVRVVFSPRATGVRSATLNVPAEAGGVRSITVIGQALAGPPGAPGAPGAVGAGVDRVAPGVTSKSPAPGAKRVKRDRNVVAGFSEAVQGVSKATLKLTDQKSGDKVKAKITKLSGNRWRLDPKSKLKRNTDYRVRLIGTSSGIRDLAGNPLANTGWKFHTR